MLVQVAYLVAGRSELDNVLVILCRHRTVKREKKGETNVTMSWLYYVATGSRV